MTYDGTTRRNFQDGTAITDVNDPAGAIGDTADALRIGSDVRWDFSPNGRIDDVRIWSVARTAGEVAAGMNGVDPNSPGLVAQWTFDGGSTVDSANGLTGTLVGDVEIAEEAATPTVSGSPGPTSDPTATRTPAPSRTPGVAGRPGDVTCDGQISLEDVELLLRRKGGLEAAGAQSSCAGGTDPEDADCDGDSDMLDVLAIVKHLAAVQALAEAC
jgi:hypothetical protein